MTTDSGAGGDEVSRADFDQVGAVEQAVAGDVFDAGLALGFEFGGFGGGEFGPGLAVVFEEVDGARHVAQQDDAAALGVGVGHGGGGEQSPGVGVLGVAVKRVAVGEFDDAAQVHDGDAVAEVFDDGEVVGDEKVGEAEFVLEVLEKVEDLGLDADVEGGDGFVADDEFGIETQGAGNTDALALAAGKLVGVTVGVVALQADFDEQVGDAVGGSRLWGAAGERPWARRRCGRWSCGG